MITGLDKVPQVPPHKGRFASREPVQGLIALPYDGVVVKNGKDDI